MKRQELLILFMILLGIGAEAQSSELSMSLSKETVIVGERFKLTITLEGSDSPIVPPSLNGLRSLSPPMQGEATKDLFGEISFHKSLTYLLRADKAGTYEIGSAEARTTAGRIKSNTLTLEVIEADSAAKVDESTMRINMPNGFKLMAFASKKEVVVGEPILISYILYTNKDNIELNQFGNPPQHKGFISDGTLHDELRWEVAPDRSYKKKHIADQILVPLNTGEFVLDPYEIAVVRVQFFNSKKYAAKSDPIKVKVNPLPPGASHAFKGAVGEMNIRASLSQPKVESNMPVHLQVFISGNGNLESLSAPVLDLSEDLEAYEPEITDKLSTATGTISGTRIFDYLLIPRKAGKHRIAPIAFEYYDTEQKAYVQLSTKPFFLVSEGEGQTASIERPGEVLTDKTEEKDPTPNSGTSTLLTAKHIAIGLGIPALAFLLLIGYKKLKSNSEAKAQRKAKQADQIAERILKEAGAQKDAGNNSGFYSSLYQAMNRYVEQKLEIPTAEMSRKRISAALKQQSVDEPTIASWNRVLDQCEQAAYSRVGVANPESLYAEVSAMVKALEGQLN